MDSRPWPEELRHKLLQQKLPRAYIDRLVEELSDHLLDSQTETTSMEAQNAFGRLGSTSTIAAAAGYEFRRRTFVGRHPWLTFVFSPFLVAPLAFLLFTLFFVGLFTIVGGAMQLAGWQFIADNPLEDSFMFAIAQAFNLLVRFVPFIIAAWLYCRLAKRSGRDHWSIAACAILALIAGSLVSQVTPATHKFCPNSWIVGIGYPLGRHPSTSLHQLLQVLAPLAVPTWFLLHFRQPISPTTAAI